MGCTLLGFLPYWGTLARGHENTCTVVIFLYLVVGKTTYQVHIENVCTCCCATKHLIVTPNTPAEGTSTTCLGYNNDLLLVHATPAQGMNIPDTGRENTCGGYQVYLIRVSNTPAQGATNT